MKKLIIAGALATAALLTVSGAQQAQAQTTYPSVSGLRAFSQEANYMSLPGYLRYRYFLDSGRWISREEAESAARSQGV